MSGGIFFYKVVFVFMFAVFWLKKKERSGFVVFMFFFFLFHFLFVLIFVEVADFLMYALYLCYRSETSVVFKPLNLNFTFDVHGI